MDDNFKMKLAEKLHYIIDLFAESRVRDYVLLCMTSERSPRQSEAPLALMNIQDELKILAGRFARLITHNRNVYSPLYNGMIDEMLKEMSQVPHENENEIKPSN